MRHSLEDNVWYYGSIAGMVVAGSIVLYGLWLAFFA